MLKFHQKRFQVAAWFLLSMGLTSIAQGQFGCDASSGCDAVGCGPTTRWSFGAKALFLERADDDVRIFSGANGNFDSDEFDLGFQAGYELNGRYNLNDSNALTVRWMSVDQWSDSHRDLVGPASNATLNAALPVTFPGVTSIDGVHTSDLHSLELGISRRLTESVRLTTGFRYLEIDDRIGFRLDAAATPTTIDTAAQNRLYGGQIGLESELFRKGKWSLDGFGQVGLFGNAAKQSTLLDTGVVQIRDAGDRGKFSFLAELGLNARRNLTSQLDLVAGYQIMWITSVAVASDELVHSNFIAPHGVDASDSVFYHGATVGLEYHY
ncbi:Lpg1974 family pore-forming outer membrane protein [Rosistilla oblonga]|uniref:Lpg1974 family pore-forming outer membrane protein n=1 Tax=Rosistilla oblonga TaxID=2527990 RepID=UPI003A972290